VDRVVGALVGRAGLPPPREEADEVQAAQVDEVGGEGVGDRSPLDDDPALEADEDGPKRAREDPAREEQVARLAPTVELEEAVPSSNS
jgi:hypothetical protein